MAISSRSQVNRRAIASSMFSGGRCYVKIHDEYLHSYMFRLPGASMSINSFHLHYCLSHKLFSPFYRWVNWVSRRLSHLLSQWGTHRGTQIFWVFFFFFSHAVSPSRPCSWTLVSCQALKNWGLFLSVRKSLFKRSHLIFVHLTLNQKPWW